MEARVKQQSGDTRVWVQDLGHHIQELLQRVTSDLQILLEEIQDPQHQFLDILQPQGPRKLALSISEAVLELARGVWHTLASCVPTSKRAKRRVFGPAKFLFYHPAPNLLVVQAVAESARSHYQRTISADKGCKRLDLLGRKVFSSAGLQFHVANYQA